MKSKYRYLMVVMVAFAASIFCVNSVVAQDMEYSYYPAPEASNAPKIRIEWGVGIGGSYTGIQSVSTEDVKLSPRLGITGHLDVALRIGRHFAIESEVIYEGASIMAASKSMEHRVKTRTVDIPILLSLRMLNHRIRVSAGPLFTVMSKSEYTDNGDVMFYGPVHPTWNIAAGVGVGITRNFIIEARYIYALTDSVNQFGGIEFTTRPYRVTAGVTLMF